MTVMTQKANGFAAAWDEFAAGAADSPAWLVDLRRTTYDRFAGLGLPTLDHEDWRFTDVSRLGETAYSLAPRSAEVPPDRTVPTFDALAGPRLTFVDGRFRKDLSEIGKLPDGILVMSMAQAMRDHADLVEPHLGALPDDGEAFTALNGAFLEDGLFVHVPAGGELPGVVQARFIASAASEPVMTHPHSLIVVEAGGKATVLEELLSADEAGPEAFTNGVTQFVLGENACGRHYLIENENERACIVSSLYVRQHADSDFASHSVLIGGDLVRNNVFPTLLGEGCLSVINGVYVPHDTQLHDNRMLVRHTQPNCRSRQHYRGILGGRARAMFSGRIIVDEGAQKTDAVQSNKNLLLSRHAMAQTKPQLEIYADDVKCTHGATTGQIDDSALFYFQARGITPKEARRLLVFAFVNEIFERMESEPVQERLREMVAARLESSEREA
ncbi:Fe-S cluster assembly protein SufD [bacterium]|nr:Fe-S cluster assembly protein SufD [bacterium]